jgi:uncharacterized repeat protein (TIGR02543 family)
MKKLFERRLKMRKLLVSVFVAVFVAAMCVPSYGGILVYKTSQKTSAYDSGGLEKDTLPGYLVVKVDPATQAISEAQLLTYWSDGAVKAQQTENVTVTFTSDGGYILAKYLNGTSDALLAGKAAATGIAKTLSGYLLIDDSGFGTLSATLDTKTTTAHSGDTDISTALGIIRAALVTKGYVDQSDVTPPQPSPMTWAVEPNAGSDTTITMTATTATDATPPIKYYFTNVTDSTHNSGPQSSPTWTDSGLTPDTNYTYTVTAQDSAPALNSTIASAPATARTLPGPDLTPPDPSPMTWATVPTAVSSTSITMSATAATDATPPVKYYFTNVTDPNRNSGWKYSDANSTNWNHNTLTWTDTGLNPGVNYSYNVKAQDSAPALNTTLPSTPDLNATTTPLAEYTLTITPVGSGTVAKVPDNATYHLGDVVTLTPTAATGWTFSGWTGDVNGANQITIDGNEAVTATFTQNVYTLTVDVNGDGTVANDINAPYHYGNVVTLRATPATGWSFVNWTGDVNDVNSAVVTTTMTSNKTVTVNFTTTHNYTMEVDVNGGGSVAKNPDQATYHPGDVVTLTATPQTGWSFVNWTGDANSDANGSSSNPKMVTINGNTDITANFAATQFTVTITTVGRGTVTKNPNQSTYTLGINNLVLTATPDTNWAFSGWSGDIDSDTNVVTISTNSNKNITATFVPAVRYTLTIGASTHGSVAKDPNEPSYAYGDVVTLIPTANTGYSFTSWTGDNGADVNAGNQIIMDGNENVTPVFTAGTYTLTIDVNAVRGSVTPSPSAPYHYGDVVTLTPTANTGWTFSGWTGANGADVNGANKITMNSNKAVTANFTQNVYTLTLDANGTGSGTATKSPNQATYHYGDLVTLTATPNNSNFEAFTRWVGDVNSTVANGTSNPKTILMPAANMDVNATFTIREFTLNIVYDPNSSAGTVTKSPNQSTYHYGDPVTLTGTPSWAGWSVSGWSGDANGTDSSIVLVIDTDPNETVHFTH